MLNKPLRHRYRWSYSRMLWTRPWWVCNQGLLITPGPSAKNQSTRGKMLGIGHSREHFERRPGRVAESVTETTTSDHTGTFGSRNCSSSLQTVRQTRQLYFIRWSTKSAGIRRMPSKHNSDQQTEEQIGHREAQHIRRSKQDQYIATNWRETYLDPLIREMKHACGMENAPAPIYLQGEQIRLRPIARAPWSTPKQELSMQLASTQDADAFI